VDQVVLLEQSTIEQVESLREQVVLLVGISLIKYILLLKEKH
jgi:hypothetical protein